MEIVTGSTGQVHVTPIDDAVRNGNQGYLNRNVVFTYLMNFEATSLMNNEIRVYSGYGMMQGRLFKIDDNEWDSVVCENGSQGFKRADLVVARYSMDSQTGFEDISLAVIKGDAGNTYVDPPYNTGNINSGDTCDFPLYRVRLNGLNIEGLDQLFTPIPDGGRIGELEAQVIAHKTAFDALNIKTNLASENNVFLKDGANARPGVEGILPANHGGTGKATLKDGATDLIGALDANGITPTNDEYYIGSTPNTNGFQRKPLSALWSWISSKLGTMGYGDMTKGDFCDNPDSEAPSIKQSRGGTGSRDGSINGVKLGKSGTTMGYYDANNQFRSFRQPTGNAVVGNVLSGKTFANASSDALTGTMANYSGSSRRTVTPSGGTGNEQLSLSAGYHDSVIVNRTNPYNTGYNAGVAAAQATTWTEDLYAEATGPDSVKYRAIIGLPYKNVVKIKNLSSNTVTIEYTTAQGAKSQTLASQAEMTPPAGAIINAQKGPSYWFAVFGASSAVYYANFSIRVTFQTKVLR